MSATTLDPEARMLRRARLRLMAWSGGSTLVLLLLLGVAIYAVAATSLATQGVAQLRERLANLAVGQAFVASPFPSDAVLSVTGDPSQPGVLIGGGTLSGTVAVLVPGAGLATSTAPEVVAVGESVGGGLALAGIPDTLVSVEPGETQVIETTLGDTPVRVLAGPIAGAVPGAEAPMAIVMADRTAELETLRTLLAVLLTGGLAVLAASLVLGYAYAGRALVPVRESLRRQREFTADASHELRTPLAISRAAIAELRRGRDDPATVDRALDDLDAGTARMTSLVDDLLLLARTDAGAVTLDLADTDLALAAAEAVEGLEPVAAAAGVRLVLDIQPAPVRGDETRLRQLATIVVDNAIRHSPPGGRVVVAVRAGAVLTVEDEGTGVAPEHRDDVFERFWRAPGAPAGGTGLGLAIARWIAEGHGGTIAVEDRTPGPGARFVVRLPGG